MEELKVPDLFIVKCDFAGRRKNYGGMGREGECKNKNFFFSIIVCLLLTRLQVGEWGLKSKNGQKLVGIVLREKS